MTQATSSGLRGQAKTPRPDPRSIWDGDRSDGVEFPAADANPSQVVAKAIATALSHDAPTSQANPCRRARRGPTIEELPRRIVKTLANHLATG